MEQNKNQNSAKNKSLNESHISSFSSAAGMDPKDEEIRKLKAKLQQIEEANSNQFGGLSMKQMGWQFGEKFDELKKEIGKLSKENTALKEKMVKMDEMEKKMKEIEVKNTKLEGQIVAKNKEMDKMKAEMDEEKAKLKDEMKEEFNQKNAELETKMRESLEQKADKKELANLIGRIDGMDFVQMKNKWNAADCGPKLDISEGGLVVKHNGLKGFNCIRAISPIPTFNSNATNPSIAGYFEARILHKKWIDSIDIGFCTQQFPLEWKWLGDEENSIGIWSKEGMDIDGQFNKFGNNANGYFNAGDVIGVGIIHSPATKSMKCFSTLNGQLLGTFKLPDDFWFLELFPAATFCNQGDSIRANFGAKKWLFDPSQLLQ